MSYRQRRGREIKYAAMKWGEQDGGLILATLTFPHWFGLALAMLWVFVSKGLTSCRNTRAWRALKADLGITFDIRALEVTVGLNGWHPHCHLLLFMAKPPDAEALAKVKVYFDTHWGRWVAGHGFGDLHAVHGVDVTPIRAEDTDYLGKVQAKRWDIGRELAGVASKGGRQGHRTFFEVLADAREHGDPRDIALIREFAAVAPGKQMLTMSKGLRAWAGLDDLDDAELAAAVGDDEDQAEREDVALIPEAAWRTVTASEALYEGLLAACDRAGLVGINVVLAAHRLPLATSPPGRREEECPHHAAGPP